MQSVLSVSTGRFLASSDHGVETLKEDIDMGTAGATDYYNQLAECTCAMARYMGSSASTASNASSQALRTPVHSSAGIQPESNISDGYNEDQDSQEPELSKSRPGSFASIDSLQVVTPDLAQVGTAHLPDTFSDGESESASSSVSPNSIISLQALGEVTPRAQTPKVAIPSTLASSTSSTPLSPVVNTFDYKASEFVGPDYDHHSTPAASPTTSPKQPATTRILGHDENTGVTIIDFSDNIAMPRSSPSSRSSSSASIASSSSSSGSSRDQAKSVEKTPPWAQGSDTCSSIGGTYDKLMERRQEVVQEFGHDMFQLRDDEGTQSAVKSVSGRIVVKTDPKRFISVVWLPGLSRDNISIHCTSDCLNIQANSHERDEHFYWKIRLPGADLDITCASMVGNYLRVSVIKRTSSSSIKNIRRAELGVRGEDDCIPALKEATDPLGGDRAEKDLFAP